MTAAHDAPRTYWTVEVPRYRASKTGGASNNWVVIPSWTAAGKLMPDRSHGGGEIPLPLGTFLAGLTMNADGSVTAALSSPAKNGA